MPWLKWIYIVISASILVFGQANTGQTRNNQSPLPSYSVSVLFHKIRNQFYLTYQTKKLHAFLILVQVKQPLNICHLGLFLERFWSVKTSSIRLKLLRGLLSQKSTHQK